VQPWSSDRGDGLWPGRGAGEVARPEAARSPDSLRPAAPCQARRSVHAGVPDADSRGAWNGETMTTRATAPAGKRRGDCTRRGVGKSRTLPGGNPTGAASRRLAGRPRFPGPVVAPPLRARPAPAPRKAAIDRAEPCNPRRAAGRAWATTREVHRTLTVTHGHNEPASCENVSPG
jgi:hypothetical protein